MRNTIRAEVFVASPIEKVWAALTESEQIGAWFGNGQPTRIDLRPGGRIIFDHGHGDLPAIIETVEQPSQIAYRWALVGSAGTEPTDTNSTLVSFRLTSQDGGTQVDFVESGFEEITDDREQAERQYDNNLKGWSRILDSLREHTESPVQQPSVQES